MEYLLIVIMTLALSSCFDSWPSYALTSAVDSLNDTDENELWKNPFLPTTIIPIRYDLILFPNFYFNESVFEGKMRIDFQVRNETNTIILHSKNLNIIHTIVIGCEGKHKEINKTFEYEENDYFVIQTNSRLPNSTCLATLVLEFTGNMQIVSKETSDVVFGLYKTTYHNDITGKESWLVATDFQPSSSRFAFPNFDEPRFKVNFDLRLRHWKNFTALSNTERENPEDIDDIWRYTPFKRSKQMSSYLFCFIISDFTYTFKAMRDRKTQYVWARPGHLNKVAYVLNVTSSIERYLYKELRRPYLLQKLDQFAMPQEALADGMENWGLIVYKESTLAFDVTKDGDSAKQKARALIAHELSHNYFGNAVTCRFWNHVWLNEGFATFFEIRAVTSVYPTLFYKEQHFAEELEETMARDATTTAIPLVPVLRNPAESDYYFDPLRYYKGAAILRMVENILGTINFNIGIRRYVTDNEYHSVVTDDLWTSLGKIIGNRPSLNEVMKNWVYKSGFPVITVQLLPGNQINATQRRFMIDPQAVIDQEYTWYVPLTYQTKERGYQLVTMDKKNVTFEVDLNSDDDWIQLNHEMSGYYRVNYDANLWNRLMKQLKNNHQVFSETSRLKLLSDAVNLAEAEVLDYDAFLNATRYASKERQISPWLNIYKSFGEIKKMVSGTANFSHFQRYVLNLTSSLMDELQVRDEGRYIEKMLRPKIISMSCSAGHRGCIENATRLFKAWIQNDTMNASIPVNFRQDVYCIGVANSLLESDWDTVFERYKNASCKKEKTKLLTALSCSRNVTLLERLMEYATDETIMDIEEGFRIIPEIASNPASEHCIWKRLKLNNTSIDKQVKSRFFAKMLRATVQNFKTREQRQEVLDFLGNTTSVAQKRRLLTPIDINIRWMDRNLAPIVSWLERNVPQQSG